MNWENAVFDYIYKKTQSSAILSFFLISFAKYLIFVLLILVLIYLLKKKDLRYRLNVFLSSLFIFLISRCFFVFILRYFGEGKKLFSLANSNLLVSDYAFISANVAFSLALGLLFYEFSKKLSYTFFVFTFLIGLGEIGSGIKLPSDFLIGFLIGILSFLIYKKVFYIKKNENSKSVSTLPQEGNL